ncbi:hypothetical protein CEE37_01095 [candidate division LCP-89 bacterium B3_LCP]|uniref:Glycosyltransferase RgtA/B/C/D-like domain-containing protein n=1 Tax=candidate division LCP-89 bacterium B3_LCP TaxID=2012998 RepID=A0A532V535_UNCL8|nr:MAG: hypothetical protein CEE37_01095 [candidate division LCP-89 bacterium B3_LCP]
MLVEPSDKKVRDRKFGFLKSWWGIIYIIIVSYALIVMTVFPKWTVDDAYILYRYAHNLADHSELTWNVGEDPIEGYTGIALPVILALFAKLGISPLVMSKIIGIIFYFVSGFVLHLLLRKLKVQRLAHAIVLILYFTAPFNFVHAWSGMETTFFGAILLVCIYALFSNLTPSDKRGPKEAGLILLLLFAGFVRPEGVILAVMSFIALAYYKRKYDRNEFWRFIVRFCILFVIPGFIYFICRWQYYGQFFPNTFYAKDSPTIFEKWSIIKLAIFSIFYLAIPTIGCIILNSINLKAVIAQVKGRYSFLMKPEFLIAGFAVLAFAVLVNFQYLRSRLLMNFEFRFFVPFFSISLIFLGVFLSLGFHALKEVRHNKPMMYRIIGTATIILFAVQLLVNVNQLKKYVYLKTAYKSMIDEEHIPAGTFLRESVPSDEWLIVIHDTGAIPYYSGLKTVDFSRLNDEVLLKKDLSTSEILDYFYSFNAGAVVITSYEWDKIHQPWIYGPEAELIASDPRFEQYVLVKKYKADVPPESPAHDYFLFLFLRKDLSELLDAPLTNS